MASEVPEGTYTDDDITWCYTGAQIDCPECGTENNLYLVMKQGGCNTCKKTFTMTLDPTQ